MRNSKTLQKKSRQHSISHLSPYAYKVTSGNSGKEYHVNPATMTCDCPWGQHRPASDKRSGCSHLISVLNYIKSMEEERRIMVCGSEEETLRSKRALAGGLDGLILVTRKV